jgi:hypothetical protein
MQPRDESNTIIISPSTGKMLVPGETSINRTIYSVVGFCCAVLLSLFLGMCMRGIVLSSKIMQSKWMRCQDIWV